MFTPSSSLFQTNPNTQNIFSFKQNKQEPTPNLIFSDQNSAPKKDDKQIFEQIEKAITDVSQIHNQLGQQQKKIDLLMKSYQSIQPQSIESKKLLTYLENMGKEVNKIIIYQNEKKELNTEQIDELNNQLKQVLNLIQQKEESPFSKLYHIQKNIYMLQSALQELKTYSD